VVGVGRTRCEDLVELDDFAACYWLLAARRIIEISFAVYESRRGGVFGAAALRAAHEYLSRGHAPRESGCFATGGGVRSS
jgi:hypothetical protein